MASRRISDVPRIAQFLPDQSLLTSFCGALYAALHGLGAPRAYADLLAFSGAGCRLSWLEGTWFGGNSDLISCEEPPFAPHLRVLRALGIAGQVRMTRTLNGTVLMEETGEETARTEIVASIDVGVPVIAMGIIGPPECCVITGYEEDGDKLVGWSYFQADEGFAPDQPFVKSDWFGGMYGYVLLTARCAAPDERAAALAGLRAMVRHARQGEVRGAKVGLVAWRAMLHQLEYDDFTGLPATFDAVTDAVWAGTVQGRFFIYCDALCQVHERGVMLPYLERLCAQFPEEQSILRRAIKAWRVCAAYGGYLWQHVTMDPAGYERFRLPEVRKILAEEGVRSMDKDAEAIEAVEEFLAAVESRSRG